MGVPPEVLLDRFLRGDRLPQAVRDLYRGKQDLEQLEPNLRSLLTSVQETLNEALSRVGLTRERPSKFHFDYVGATCSNALAFEYEGYSFIVVTMPLIRELWQASSQLSRSVEV